MLKNKGLIVIFITILQISSLRLSHEESWDAYIDFIIRQSIDAVGQTCVDKAAIIGLDGSLWTTTKHPNSLKITLLEANTIASAIRKGDFTTFQNNGIVIEGIKFQYMRNNDGFVLGKKKDNGAIILESTKTAIVIAHTIEGKSQGITIKGVSAVTQYLKSLEM